MYNEWIERDKKVNWHPYTQMKTTTHIPIMSGKDAYLYDANGKQYIDAVSSWWVTLHGHANKYIAEKVSQQLTTLEQVIFAGFTHKPAIELSERLLQLLPDNQTKVFYTDNGSTAIEVALKMCLQFEFHKKTNKQKILAFKNGYHGDTFGAMSVSGRGTWTAPFNDFLFDVVFIDVPTQENLSSIKEIISGYNDISCFVYEPLIQGSAGMLMHEARYLDELLGFCKSQNILLIQDEIFVGFGRTGKLFAANHLKCKPDIMCFSKGLTGGTMPLGITTCTEDIFNAFYDDDKTKALFHGHSFTANPLACAAALASMDLLLKEDTLSRINEICKLHEQFRKKLIGHEKIKDVRQTGTILAIEYKVQTKTSYFNELNSILYSFFLKQGILIRPLGNIIYLVPPYCISTNDLKYIYEIITDSLEIV